MVNSFHFAQDPVMDLQCTIGYKYATCRSDISRVACPGHTRMVCIEGVNRRLIVDDDFGFMWYNAEGPEE
jgi:hypothetical protein